MFPEAPSVCWIGAGIETEPVASCPSGEILSEAGPVVSDMEAASGWLPEAGKGHQSCGLTGLDPAGQNPFPVFLELDSTTKSRS